MDAKNNAKKAIKKRDRNRLLQTLSYVAGFPLLILIVFIGSTSFIEGTGFEATKYYGVIACALAWLIVTIFQIIVTIITRSSTARGAVVILVTLIVMIGAPVFFDIKAEEKVEDIRKAYVRTLYGLDEETDVKIVKNYSGKDVATFEDEGYIKNKYNAKAKGITFGKNNYDMVTATFKVDDTTYTKVVEEPVDIVDYNKQVNHYVTWTNKGSLTADYSKTLAEFCRVYNIGLNSDVKLPKNDDGFYINSDGGLCGKAPTIIDEEGNEVPETWFGEKGEVYKENGLYADGYIFSAPVAMEILKTYYTTNDYYASIGKNADEEYQEALTEARKSSEWRNYTKTEEYKLAYGSDGKGGEVGKYMITNDRLVEIVDVLGDEIIDKDLIGSLPNLAPSLGDTLNLGKIVQGMLDEKGLTDAKISNLTLDGVLDLVNGLGLFEEDLTEDDIMALLAGFSNYQASNIKPDFAFIKDEKLRTYGYAKYFGETHGANIGSVLIPNSAGKIGHITMNTSGLTASENEISLNEIYRLSALNSFVPQLYPLFAARRYLYIFAGIISLMFAIYYYSQMKANLIRKKLEKMSTLGGAR